MVSPPSCRKSTVCPPYPADFSLFISFSVFKTSSILTPPVSRFLTMQLMEIFTPPTPHLLSITSFFLTFNHFCPNFLEILKLLHALLLNSSFIFLFCFFIVLLTAWLAFLCSSLIPLSFFCKRHLYTGTTLIGGKKNKLIVRSLRVVGGDRMVQGSWIGALLPVSFFVFSVIFQPLLLLILL